MISATAQGEGNAVEAELAGAELALDVWSARGIGAATVELVAGPPPTAVALRLHLRGLEELRVAYGEETIVVSVASGPGHAVSQRRVTAGGAEQALEPGAPGWVEVDIVGAEPDAPFPLSEGHFAVTLPPAVLAEGGAFGIQWVDFFR